MNRKNIVRIGSILIPMPSFIYLYYSLYVNGGLLEVGDVKLVVRWLIVTCVMYVPLIMYVFYKDKGILTKLSFPIVDFIVSMTVAFAIISILGGFTYLTLWAFS